jgi:hypothetical protein
MSIPIMNPRLLMIPALLSLLLWCLPAAATSVLPLSLQRMSSAAHMIFHGRVIGNEVRLDPISGQVATFTRFEIIEAVKGDPGKTYTIKQIGGQLPGGNVRLVIQGVPRFAVDMEYVVFLPKVSSLGFASPIGLSQGKFDIRKFNGQTVVSNNRAHAATTASTLKQALSDSPSAIETGAVSVLNTTPDQPATTSLTDFLQAVRGMLTE